jgi:hypothetical protein
MAEFLTMTNHRRQLAVGGAIIAINLALPALAQDAGMAAMPGMSAPPIAETAKRDQPDMAGMDMSATEVGARNDATVTDMPAMDMSMTGAFGPYAMSREASGTSWQPDSTPHSGLDFTAGPWMLMAHGYADAIYDNQGGRRGNDKTFGASMAMLMAQRPVGEDGRLGLRAMLSLDPLMGANGYPLLFATGETANGRDGLVDRQHPHDLFMELSVSYSLKLSADSSAFLYAGLPGEPALGPPAFMHRFSGMDNPEAPITHHWLDSTHVTFGVVTAGFVQGPFKIEASAFRGREPDQHRYDIEAPKLDSASVRLSWNPAPNWSFQTSWGYLKSPEQLTPEVNENRLTASGTYTLPFGENIWSTTFAWGRKMNNPGHTLDGFLLESAVVLHDTHTFFGRVERVDEDELFEGGPLQGRVFTANKISLGYVRDFHLDEHVKLGIGGLVSRYAYPAALDSAYGDPTSFMVFLRLKLG